MQWTYKEGKNQTLHYLGTKLHFRHFKGIVATLLHCLLAMDLNHTGKDSFHFISPDTAMLPFNLSSVWWTQRGPSQ